MTDEEDGDTSRLKVDSTDQRETDKDGKLPPIERQGSKLGGLKRGLTVLDLDDRGALILTKDSTQASSKPSTAQEKKRRMSRAAVY